VDQTERRARAARKVVQMVERERDLGGDGERDRLRRALQAQQGAQVGAVDVLHHQEIAAGGEAEIVHLHEIAM